VKIQHPLRGVFPFSFFLFSIFSISSLDRNDDDDDDVCDLAAHQLLVLKLRVELSLWTSGSCHDIINVATLQVAGVVAATAGCNVTCVAGKERDGDLQLMLLHHAIVSQQCGLPLPLPLPLPLFLPHST